jgi:hypothetical protein
MRKDFRLGRCGKVCAASLTDRQRRGQGAQRRGGFDGVGRARIDW